MFSEVGQHVGGVEELDCGDPGRDVNTVSIVTKHHRAPPRPAQLQLLPGPEQRGDLNSGDERENHLALSVLTWPGLILSKLVIG